MDLVVALFRVLANGLRLRLLQAVHTSPGITVTGLARRLGVPNLVMSQHLRLLADFGLVDTRPSGRVVHVHPARDEGFRSALVRSVPLLLSEVWKATPSANSTPAQVWNSAVGDGRPPYATRARAQPRMSTGEGRCCA
jgi:DNA-binding transcriptional ArsR family regulator